VISRAKNDSKQAKVAADEVVTQPEVVESFQAPPAGAMPPPGYVVAPSPLYSSVQAPVPPPPPPASSVPPWMWVSLGVLLAGGGMKALQMLGGAKQSMQDAAMQQMLKTMMAQAGGPGGAPPPSPFTPPMGTPPTWAPPPTPNPAAWAPTPPPSQVPPPPTPASVPSPPKDSATASDSNSSKSMHASNSATAEKSPVQKSSSSMFKDVDPSNIAAAPKVEATESAVEAEVMADRYQPGETGRETAPGDDPWAAWGGAPPGANYAGMPSPGPGGMTGAFTLEMFEKMIDDPTMQGMLLPHLPEGMRDPATIKFMLENPMYRNMLEQSFEQMNSGQMDPQMMERMKDFDVNNPEVKSQFDQLGVSPQDVMSKISENPEIAVAFQNPKIQAAIMDCSTNPMNISKYQNDPEVMQVFLKISTLFPGAGMS